MVADYASTDPGIVMTEDDEGFEYPVINKGLCIGCNMCKNVCPNKHRSSRI